MTGDAAAVRIITPEPEDERVTMEMAELLLSGFGEMAPGAWPDLPAAQVEVRQALAPERVCLAAVDGDDAVLGWIGGIPIYDGNVVEMHPLVVRPDVQRRGIGRALVAALEDAARRAGAFTVYLGSDDESEMTSLGGANLLPGALKRLREIRNLRGHPFEFYQRVGYEVVGLLPDANGPGKPDIFLAKSLRS